MLKCWQGYCKVPIKSFWLELVAIEFLARWQWAGYSKLYYDWMVGDFLAYLVGRACTVIYVPGTCEAIYLGHDWKSKAESARDRAQRACHNEANSLTALACEELQKIFGGFIK